MVRLGSQLQLEPFSVTHSNLVIVIASVIVNIVIIIIVIVVIIVLIIIAVVIIVLIMIIVIVVIIVIIVPIHQVAAPTMTSAFIPIGSTASSTTMPRINQGWIIFMIVVLVVIDHFDQPRFGKHHNVDFDL